MMMRYRNNRWNDWFKNKGKNKGTLIYSACNYNVWSIIVKWEHDDVTIMVTDCFNIRRRVRINPINPGGGGGGGGSHMEQTGMLVGNFEFNPSGAGPKLFVTPKGDQSGRSLSKFWPLKETTLKGKKEEKENLTSVSLHVILCFFAEP